MKMQRRGTLVSRTPLMLEHFELVTKRYHSAQRAPRQVDGIEHAQQDMEPVYHHDDSNNDVDRVNKSWVIVC